MAGMEVGWGLLQVEGTVWTKGLRNGQRHNKTLGRVFSRTRKLGRLGSTWRACGQSGQGDK